MASHQDPLAKKMKRDDAHGDKICPSENTIEGSNCELLKDANEALKESNRIHVRPIVDEKKLGIELFVGDKNDQFHGLIKTRYADFIVHEIDPDGNLARLTVLDPPEEQEQTNSTCLKDFLDDKALESLTEVNTGLLLEYKIDVTGMDKDTRTSLHYAIRGAFDRLESSTIVDSEKPKNDSNGDKHDTVNDSKPDSTQQVVVEATSSEKKLGDQESKWAEEKKYILVTRRNKISRPKNVWPRDRPDHTHFILYKENKDTMDAIHSLASSINAKPSNFASAGLKDRRAVTTQWLSSWRLEPRRLISATKRFNKRPFIKVGNFCFKKDPIKLGQLKANRFDIIIRHLVHNSGGLKVVDASMKSVRDNGFVNYFGLQRFGTRSIQTHEIGLAILETRWEEAIDLILSYRYDDNMQPLNVSQDKIPDSTVSDTDASASPSIDNMRARLKQRDNRKWTNGAEDHNAFIDLWKTKLDADVVFKKYPQFRFTNEGMIIRTLSKSESSSRDYLGAIVSLPRNTRSMYVHSYQSLLWNRMATYRLKTHGFKVIPGDLILSSDSNVSDNSLEILLTADEDDTAESREKLDSGSLKNDGGTSNGNSNANGNRRAPIEDIDSKIIVATEENAKNHSIFDVVLPLVGSRVRLPNNDVGQEFQRLLKEDNLTIESFKAHERLFISFGSYRKIMVKPEHVEWSIKQYSDPSQNLVETDLDRLNREFSSKDNELSLRSPPKSDSSDEALIVSFELPPSSYATMCLREIMKKPSTDFNNRF